MTGGVSPTTQQPLQPSRCEASWPRQLAPGQTLCPASGPGLAPCSGRDRCEQRFLLPSQVSSSEAEPETGILVQGTDWGGPQRTPEGVREADRTGKKP